jgi:hypothetical protein
MYARRPRRFRRSSVPPAWTSFGTATTHLAWLPSAPLLPVRSLAAAARRSRSSGRTARPQTQRSQSATARSRGCAAVGARPPRCAAQSRAGFRATSTRLGVLGTGEDDVLPNRLLRSHATSVQLLISVQTERRHVQARPFAFMRRTLSVQRRPTTCPFRAGAARPSRSASWRSRPATSPSRASF